MKAQDLFILIASGLGVLATAYLLLVIISFAAMLDGGGSGLILDSMLNPYFAIPIFLSALSLLLTWDKAEKIMTKER
jgi:hypothetical protein